MACPSLQLGGLPVGAFALHLAEQLQVAVEALEAGGTQRRRHLALQTPFRDVAAAADAAFGTVSGIGASLGLLLSTLPKPASARHETASSSVAAGLTGAPRMEATFMKTSVYLRELRGACSLPSAQVGSVEGVACEVNSTKV